MITGLRTFHFSEDQNKERGSGSILQPTGHLTHFPHIRFPTNSLVPTYSLDDLYERERIERCDLLYVDVQGAEKEMILGGQDALKRTRFLFTESEKVEFASCQALRPELLKMLDGWELIGDFDYNILLRNARFAA